MERKDLISSLESIVHSSCENSEMIKEALTVLQNDEEIISALRQEVETLKASLFIATTRAKPDGHGHWVGKTYGGKKIYDDWSCSECGRFVDEANRRRLGKYCEYCGAKMDEE